MGERFEWHYNNRNQLYSDLPGTLSMKSVHSPTSTFGSWDNIMNRTDSNAKGRAHQSKLHTQQEKVSKRVLVPEHDPANLDSPRKTTSQLTKESTRQRKEHVACRPVTQGDRILYRNATSEANILNMKGNDGYAYKGKIVQQDTVLPDRRFKRHCDVADIQRQSQINTLPGGHRDTVERPPRQVQSPNKQSTSENNQRRQLKACASQPVFNAHKTTFEQMDVESLVNAPHALGLVTGLQKTYFGTSTRELNPHMKKKPRPANSMNFYSSTRPW